MSQKRTPLVAIDRLDIALPKRADRSLAVSNATVSIKRGEVLCIVGESGSGKSVLASAIAGLLPGNTLKVTGGALSFDGQDILSLNEVQMAQTAWHAHWLYFSRADDCTQPAVDGWSAGDGNA
jgi:ABC-type glutathione transport system ATPase component